MMALHGVLVRNKMKDYLECICAFRTKVFDMANSGRHGFYPYDGEGFFNAVEEGFSEDGSCWTARDGVKVRLCDFL